MLGTPIVRAVARAVHRRIRRKPCPSGAHAIALTPERKIVLVKLRYAAGWRLPGGGRDEDESVEQAALRELREEIGMRSYRRIRRTPIAGVAIVDDVIYRPRKWSWEVERVREAPIDELPPDLSPLMARWIAAARRQL
jgi:8-oxo-dGTP pyrophosphatase MutT (NUDIX family)